MSILFYISLMLFLLICVLLSSMILVQESKTMGLGASFGGDAGTSLFGTSTADVLKKATAIMITVFICLSVALSIWSSLDSKAYAVVPTLIEEVQSR